jgi:hypothetical protein
MATTGDRLGQLEARIAELAAKRKNLKDQRARERRRLDAKGADVRTEADAALKRIEPQLQEVERDLARAEREHELESARRQIGEILETMKGEEGAALEVGGVGSPESDRAVAARLLDLSKVRAMQRFLKGRVDELVEPLREFVLANFKAYTRNDEPKKRYPAWFADASLFIAVLEDNPLYSLTREQLIAFVGLERAAAFFKVDYGAVEEAVQKGLLTDTHGNTVDLEQLVAVRTRSERTPSLEFKPRGDKPIEELLDLIDPRFADRGLTVDALSLDTATTNALRAAGYTKVEQVRASFDTLQSIKGIGPKRAAKIIDALVARATE